MRPKRLETPPNWLGSHCERTGALSVSHFLLPRIRLPSWFLFGAKMYIAMLGERKYTLAGLAAVMPFHLLLNPWFFPLANEFFHSATEWNFYDAKTAAGNGFVLKKSDVSTFSGILSTFSSFLLHVVDPSGDQNWCSLAVSLPFRA